MDDYADHTDRATSLARAIVSPLALLLGLVLAAGCQPGDGASQAKAAEEKDVAADRASADTGQSHEYYEAQFLQGSKVGYAHVQRSSVVEDGRDLVVTTSTTSLTVKRDGQPVTQELVYSSTDTADGQLVRFETTLSGGGGNTVTRGQVAGAVLEIQVTTLGRTETRQVPWDSDWGSFFAVERSLEQAPLKPGEKRQLKAFVPFFLQVAEFRLEAFGFELTPLLADEQELLRIKKTIDLGGETQIVSWIWCDAAGNALKSRLVGGLGGESFRAAKEIALGDLDDVAFDLFQTTIIKVDHPLQDADVARRVVYRVQMEDGDPGDVFAHGPGQSRQRVDDHTVRLAVSRQRLDDPADSSQPVRKPVPADREPNSLIQSDDESIKRLAQSVAPEETDRVKLAAALERFVGRYINRRDYSRALATAAEVAKTRQGDCTEHAVLLAALCRARGMPARVAIGLVLTGSPPNRGFAYHMWTEVWLEDRWAPLDATRSRGGIGAAHLKLSDTNLHGSSPYAAFLPVYQVLGQLKIGVIEIQ